MRFGELWRIVRKATKTHLSFLSFLFFRKDEDDDDPDTKKLRAGLASPSTTHS